MLIVSLMLIFLYYPLFFLLGTCGSYLVLILTLCWRWANIEMFAFLML